MLSRWHSSLLCLRVFCKMYVRELICSLPIWSPFYLLKLHLQTSNLLKSFLFTIAIGCLLHDFGFHGVRCCRFDLIFVNNFSMPWTMMKGSPILLYGFGSLSGILWYGSSVNINSFWSFNTYAIRIVCETELEK